MVFLVLNKSIAQYQNYIAVYPQVNDKIQSNLMLRNDEYIISEAEF